MPTNSLSQSDISNYNKKEITNMDQYCDNFSFLPTVIHEVRNPLNAIIGFSEIVKMNLNKPGSKKDCKEYIDDIQEVAYDLNELLGDLLYFFKQESFSNFKIDLNHKINVRDVVRKAIKINSDFAFKSNIRIAVDIDDSIPDIYLDKRRLKQIMINLINNAIKYSPDSTLINITSLVKDKRLIISVKDTGCGIRKENLNDIFNKFNSNNKNISSDSFGLGLSVVKELVEAQNGIIRVKSEVGIGSEFSVEFEIQN